jgi:hypothetical protein
MDMYYIIIFQNTHSAMSGENILKKNNIKLEIMPTPTVITKSCGISIKVGNEFIEQIKNLVKKGDLEIKDIYVKSTIGYNIYSL